MNVLYIYIYTCLCIHNNNNNNYYNNNNNYQKHCILRPFRPVLYQPTPFLISLKKLKLACMQRNRGVAQAPWMVSNTVNIKYIYRFTLNSIIRRETLTAI